ncbi:putative defense protein 3 [Oppia nitens]|uniref:putative defense protein 3 n=1 Tax=Oppia nitens TaxID=1686743 RepID=UPI0023DBED88|nr:putative defense protein 3 [Oppia nitens]
MFSTFKTSFAVLLSALLVDLLVDCHPTGAPESVCDTLAPSHRVKAQTSPSPYILAGNPNQGSIKLIIESPQNTAFRGFAVQAHNANGSSNEPIGRFQAEDPDNTHTINCYGHQDNTLTHSNRNDKQSVTAFWFPPENLPKGTAIKFVGTVVKDVKTFWVNLSSAPIVLPVEDIKGNSVGDGDHSHHQQGHGDDNHSESKTRTTENGSSILSMNYLLMVSANLFLLYKLFL